MKLKSATATALVASIIFAGPALVDAGREKGFTFGFPEKENEATRTRS